MAGDCSHMLRFLTAGESHGRGLVTIIDGLPSGLPVLSEELASELARRRLGYGRGARMRIERDELTILAGVRYGATTGAPVAVLIGNTEWERWEPALSPDPRERVAPITTPRPGHADLAGMMRHATHDVRDVLERASARETAARTVAGHVAKTLLRTIGIEVLSHVVSIGDVTAPSVVPEVSDGERLDASPVRVLDREAEERMIERIDEAHADRDTLGGVFEVVARGVPAGIGTYAQWDRRLDGLLAQAVMSIPGVKAVEIGGGFGQAAGRGSAAHDEIEVGYARSSNRAGGIEGGMSNGEAIRVRAAMKPLSTLMRPLRSVDVETGEPADALRERSDVCAVSPAAVVGEQMVAFVLAQQTLDQFGGTTVTDYQSAACSYRERLEQF